MNIKFNNQSKIFSSFSLFILTCLAFPSEAQWNAIGNPPHIYNSNSGDVGIGTSSPTHTLSLYRDTNANLGIVTNQAVSEATLWFRINSTVKDAGIIFRSDGRLSFNLDNVDGGFVQNNEYMTILNTGTIGMGVVSPYSASRLHIKSPDNSVWGFVSEASSSKKLIALGHDGNAGYVSVSYLDQSAYSPLNFNTSNLTRMSIAVNGDVGIGTTDTKGYKLAVAGKAIAEEIVVKLHGNWPDYVFENNYTMPTLSELENYIHRNKHLPEVPTSKEVEANGINVGEMNMLLLKKIEELTLYLLEQRNNQLELEKKNSEQSKLVKQQNELILEIENRLQSLEKGK